jgi:hypothetical protein
MPGDYQQNGLERLRQDEIPASLGPRLLVFQVSVRF